MERERPAGCGQLITGTQQILHHLSTTMNGKPYVVTIVGKVYVDTTVAVMAESEEEAERIALRGDTEEWLRDDCLSGDPVVTDVSEETWDELQYALWDAAPP